MVWQLKKTLPLILCASLISLTPMGYSCSCSKKESEIIIDELSKTNYWINSHDMKINEVPYQLILNHFYGGETVEINVVDYHSEEIHWFEQAPIQITSQTQSFKISKKQKVITPLVELTDYGKTLAENLEVTWINFNFEIKIITNANPSGQYKKITGLRLGIGIAADPYQIYEISGSSTEKTLKLDKSSDGRSLSYNAAAELSKSTLIYIPKDVYKIADYAFTDDEGFDSLIPDNIKWLFLDPTIFDDSESCCLTTIGEKAFLGAPQFHGSLYIPPSVEKIGYSAFNAARGMDGELIFGENSKLQEIGDYAFIGMNHINGSLIIPEKVQTIGKSAFENCGFNQLKLPLNGELQSIGKQSFYNCKNMKGDLIIPKTVIEIGEKAFAVEELSPTFNGQLSFADGGNENLIIRSAAFQGCSGFTGIVDLPKYMKTYIDDLTTDSHRFQGFANASGFVIHKDVKLCSFDIEGARKANFLDLSEWNSIPSLSVWDTNGIFHDFGKDEGVESVTIQINSNTTPEEWARKLTIIGMSSLLDSGKVNFVTV